MTLGEAWQEALKGRAISREAWRDPNKLVFLAERDVESPLGQGIRADRARAPQDLTEADMDADDWFVVGSVH